MWPSPRGQVSSRSGCHMSVNRPTPRRDQLDQVVIGIAEIQAPSAARPVHRTFNHNSAFFQTLPPLPLSRRRNRERDVQLTRAVVRRNDAPRYWNRFQRLTSQKQQQNVSVRHVERAKAFIAGQPVEFADIFVEVGGARQIVHVQACLDDSCHFRHHGDCIPLRPSVLPMHRKLQNVVCLWPSQSY